VGAGFLVGLLAAFMIIVLLIARFKEGGFYPPDQQMLAKAAIWLAASCLVATAALSLYRRCFGHDNSLRLGEEKSPRVERLSFAIFDIFAVCGLSFWLWSIIVRNDWLKICIILACLVVGFVGMHLRILFHELGHLMAARIVGFMPRRLQLGVGPVLMSQRSKKGFWFEWLLLPRGGFMAATPTGVSSFRLRQSFFVAGGPIADGLILFGGYRLIVAVYGSLGDSFSCADGALAAVLLLWTLSSALTGLLPTKAAIGGRRFLTDGYLLLRLWTASNQRLAEWASISDWRKALDLLQGTDENRKAIRNAGSQEARGSASPSENLRILQVQRNRLASEVLRRSGMEGGSA